MTYLYCIDHNMLEFVQNSPVGICHDYTILNEFGIEVDWCSFDMGYATCPPPEEYPDCDLDFEEELVEVEYESII